MEIEIPQHGKVEDCMQQSSLKIRYSLDELLLKVLVFSRKGQMGENSTFATVEGLLLTEYFLCLCPVKIFTFGLRA